MKYPIEVLIAKIKFEISLLELETILSVNQISDDKPKDNTRDIDVFKQILEILERERLSEYYAKVYREKDK